MSAFLADEIIDPFGIVEGYPGYSVVAFTAGLARRNGQRIMRSPDPDRPNDLLERSHVEVMGAKTKAVRKAMAREAEIVLDQRIVSES